MVGSWAEFFCYDRTSPSHLRWRKRVGKSLKIRPGDAAGSQHKSTSGILRYKVMLDYKSYFVHRIIWEMHNGEIPEGYEVDHINGNALDNNLGNLRVVTRLVNARNRRMQTSNTSGVTGVQKIQNELSVSWRACWIKSDGSTGRATFSERTHGAGAKELAVAARAAALACVEHYTERHGK